MVALGKRQVKQHALDWFLRMFDSVFVETDVELKWYGIMSATSVVTGMRRMILQG